MFFLQYECAATKQVKVGKGSTISTIKYSLGRLMRTNANWRVCYNTQGRAWKIAREEGGGTENVLRLQGKLSTRTLSKYVVRLVVKLEDCGLCLHVVE